MVHLKRFHMDGGSARKDARIVDFPLKGLDLEAVDAAAAARGRRGHGADGREGAGLEHRGAIPVQRVRCCPSICGRGLHSGHYVALVHDRPRGCVEAVRRIRL